MRRLASYLTFNGNCRDAMEFYQQCLGGSLALQLVGDVPGAEQMPEYFKSQVLHGSLTLKQLMICGTDMVDAKGLMKGTAISLWLECDTEEEVNNLYIKLSAGGIADHPPQPTYWGGLSGDLTDKYGNQWLLHYNKTNI